MCHHPKIWQELACKRANIYSKWSRSACNQSLSQLAYDLICPVKSENGGSFLQHPVEGSDCKPRSLEYVHHECPQMPRSLRQLEVCGKRSYFSIFWLLQLKSRNSMCDPLANPKYPFQNPSSVKCEWVTISWTTAKPSTYLLQKASNWKG